MADITRFSSTPFVPATPSSESITTLSVPAEEQAQYPAQTNGLPESDPFTTRFTSGGLDASPSANSLNESLLSDLLIALLGDVGGTAPGGTPTPPNLVAAGNGGGTSNPPEVETNDNGEISWGIDAQTDSSPLAGDTTAFGSAEVANAFSEPALGNGVHYANLADNQFVQKDGSELFPPTGPTPYDVFQGTNGDCYLMATMAAMAQHDPSALANMIKPTGNGAYAVTLYYEGKPETVNVDGEVPTNAEGNPDYAHLSLDPNNGKVILWPLIMEKAFAKFADQHPDVLDTTDPGYEALNDGGFGSEAMAALTGQPVYTNTPQNMDPSVLAEALTSGSGGNMVTVGTDANPNGEFTQHGLLASHMYTVLGTATSSTGELLVKLRDPWGSEPNDPNAQNGTFYVPFSDIEADCRTINVGQQSIAPGEASSAGQQSNTAFSAANIPQVRYSR